MEVVNSKKKRIMLRATEHNWGLMGPGRWREVEWCVYRDGSYKVISWFNPSLEESEERLEQGKLPQPKKRMLTGMMDQACFTKLKEILKSEPWRDPNIHSRACDGTAWEIKSYKSNGCIEKTSGKLGYIYGHQVLEGMVGLLPRDAVYR